MSFTKENPTPADSLKWKQFFSKNELITHDPFLDEELCYQRLKKDYEKHKSLVVALDYDGTIFDCHGLGFQFPKVIGLIKESYALGFKIVIFTASATDRYSSIEEYLKQEKIPYHGINKNVVRWFDDKDRSSSKIYYNVFLCDRAGLPSAYRILRRLVDEIKGVEFN